MAAVSESLKKSSISVENISKSLLSTRKTVSSVNDSVNNISKIIANNTRIKRELFSSSETIDARRREASKRREMEDQIEASKLSYSPRSAISFASKSQGGPLSRLLGFLGFTFAGWIVENLPNWIFMGKEFISRIETFGRSMYDMVDNMRSIIESFGSVLTNSFDAILRLDFNEFSEGSVARSFDELNLAVQGLGDDITETFRLFTTPLNESVETGEQAPALDEDRPEKMFPPISQPGERKVTGIHREALDIIAGPESGGNYNAMNQGTDAQGRIIGSTAGGKTSKDIIGKNLTDMTIGEIMDRQNERKYPRNAKPDLGIHAAGKYQIIGNTLPTAMRQAGLKPSDKFSPENQDLLGLAILKNKGIGAWTSGGSRYSAKETAIIKEAQRTEVKFLTSPSSQPSSTSTTISTPQNFTGTFLQGSTGQSTGPHFHFGPGPANAKMAQQGDKFPGKYYSDVREVAFNVAKKFLNKRKGFLLSRSNRWINPGVTDSDLKSALLKEQQVHTSRGSDGGIDMAFADQVTLPLAVSDVKNYDDGFGISGTISGTNVFVGHGAEGSRSSMGSNVVTKEQAQISAPPKAGQPAAAMTPERKGPEVMLIDATQPQTPQVSYPAQQSSPQIQIDQSKMLNNFIKKKLLLDLAYT